MTSHVLTPIRALLARLRRKPEAKADPLAWLEGLEVPEHLRGRPINVLDSEGRVVAPSRRQYDATTRAMIG